MHNLVLTVLLLHQHTPQHLARLGRHRSKPAAHGGNMSWPEGDPGVVVVLGRV